MACDECIILTSEDYEQDICILDESVGESVLCLDCETTICNRDYLMLDNKPSINEVTLTGNKSFEELGAESMTNAELEALTNWDSDT